MKYVLIMLTWFGSVVPMEQEFEHEDKRACDKMLESVESDWADAPREFVGIMVCEKKP
jgi:hypothetical protein